MLKGRLIAKKHEQTLAAVGTTTTRWWHI